MPRGGCTGCGIPDEVEQSLVVLTWVCAAGWGAAPQAVAVSPLAAGSQTWRMRRMVPWAGDGMMWGWVTGS